MKIIKANDGANWTKIVTCRTCTSELEVILSDLWIAYEQNIGHYTKFRCPVCTVEDTIPVDETPIAWSKKAINKYDANSRIDPY